MALHEPLTAPGRGELARVGVVVSHGFSGSPESVRPWAEHFAAQGFAVNMPLLPGHGTTWQEMSHTPWQRWYSEVERAYFELSSQCDQVFIAGLSMGGALALRVAEHHPVAGLALVNPALAVVDPRAKFANVMQHLLKSTPAIGNDILKPGVNEHAYDRTPVASVAQLMKLIKDTKANLARVTAPIMLLHSTVDHIVAESSVDRVRAGVSSQDLHIVRLANSYHVATLDYDAPEIFSRSTAFFKELASVNNA